MKRNVHSGLPIGNERGDDRNDMFRIGGSGYSNETKNIEVMKLPLNNDLPSNHLDRSH